MLTEERAAKLVSRLLSKLVLLAALVTLNQVSALTGHNLLLLSLHNNVNIGNKVLNAATIMPPADLTPAVDKFVRVPEGMSGAPEKVGAFLIKKDGPVPDGPDPFKYVANELAPLSEFVKEMVISENPVLTMAASHFFEKVNCYSMTIRIFYFHRN